MDAKGMSAWEKQQALERESTTQVMVVQQPITGGNVCVWDAFGSYWCEKKNGHKTAATAGVSTGAGGYVKNVTQQGQSLLYEGFCGCGSETP